MVTLHVFLRNFKVKLLPYDTGVRMKKQIFFIACWLPFLCSANATPSLSPECLHAMQSLYQFYYYEIRPNPNNEACVNARAKLSESETLYMQTVIGDLKNHCPAELITQINRSLAGEASSQAQNG